MLPVVMTIVLRLRNAIPNVKSPLETLTNLSTEEEKPGCQIADLGYLKEFKCDHTQVLWQENTPHFTTRAGNFALVHVIESSQLQIHKRKGIKMHLKYFSSKLYK